MRVIKKEIFKYEELDDRAKDKAKDWYRQFIFMDSGDWEFVYEGAVQIAQILGIEIDRRPYRTVGGDTRSEPVIYFSGFWSQGDGACFEGSYRYAKGATKKIREYAQQDTELHRIADGLQNIQRRNFYKLCARMTHSGRYSHSGCMDVSVWHYDDQYRDIGDAEDEVTQLMRDFADWIYDQLEKEYEYQCSDIVVEESIIANDYEFYDDGRRA